MPDIDKQRYESIDHCLSAFRSGSVKLGDLVEQIPEILKQIDDPDPAWKDEFVSYWWTLEQIHETAIEIGESRRMPPQSRQTVDDAVNSMKKMVSSVLTSTS